MFAVAPLAGAWIEIYTNFTIRGARIVAPLAGAWIEILSGTVAEIQEWRRSPRGSVD